MNSRTTSDAGLPTVAQAESKRKSERETLTDAQRECDHDRVSEQQVCLDCGLAFHYCHACSLAGGAERGVYHAAPVCAEDSQ